MFKKILKKIFYEVELLTVLFVVLAMGITYGIIEAKWIPTHTFDLPILKRFSYYHIGLLALMTISSLSLTLSHIQWMLMDRKKYMIFMSLGALPSSLMVEDATWFIVRWQPIGINEWTMIAPGLGINLGFTWIPLWYILTIAFSVTMYGLAAHYSHKGYRKFLKDRIKADMIVDAV